MEPARRWSRRLAGAITITLTIAACGGDDDDTAADDTVAVTAAADSTAAESTTGVTAAEDTAPPVTSAPAASAPGASAPDTSGPDEATATSTPGSGAPSDTASPATTTADSAAPGTSAAAEATTTTPAPPSTYVVVAGDTLIRIAADAGVDLDALVTANGWPEGDEHVIQPGEVIQLPGAGPAAVSARDVLELELADGVSTAITDPLADGVYFALAAEPTDTGISLELAQFETTEACVERLTASTVPGGTVNDAECLGYHVFEEPTVTIEVPADAEPPVILLFPAPPDVVDLLAVESTVEVWRQLLAGEGPAWAADWLPGNAFVQLTGGVVERIEVSVIGS